MLSESADIRVDAVGESSGVDIRGAMLGGGRGDGTGWKCPAIGEPAEAAEAEMVTDMLRFGWRLCSCDSVTLDVVGGVVPLIQEAGTPRELNILSPPDEGFLGGLLSTFVSSPAPGEYGLSSSESPSCIELMLLFLSRHHPPIHSSITEAGLFLASLLFRLLRLRTLALSKASPSVPRADEMTETASSCLGASVFREMTGGGMPKGTSASAMASVKESETTYWISVKSCLNPLCDIPVGALLQGIPQNSLVIEDQEQSSRWRLRMGAGSPSY
jgi:hypothetical protein